MELLILKIVLIVLIVRLIFLTIGHVCVVFWDKATDDMVSQILKDPREYVRTEHMCKFMYNMIWFYLLIKILIGAFSNQITIN